MPKRTENCHNILIQRNGRQLFIVVANLLYFSTPGHLLSICQSVLQCTEMLSLKNITVAVQYLSPVQLLRPHER